MTKKKAAIKPPKKPAKKKMVQQATTQTPATQPPEPPRTQQAGVKLRELFQWNPAQSDYFRTMQTQQTAAAPGEARPVSAWNPSMDMANQPFWVEPGYVPTMTDEEWENFKSLYPDAAKEMAAYLSQVEAKGLQAGLQAGPETKEGRYLDWKGEKKNPFLAEWNPSTRQFESERYVTGVQKWSDRYRQEYEAGHATPETATLNRWGQPYGTKAPIF